jgi:hypothetical protein
MSNRGAESIVSLEPKANVRSEASDQLDKAGQAILGLLNRAATAAETNYQQAVEMTHKLSAQLRAADLGPTMPPIYSAIRRPSSADQ